jgi:plasmid stabilization system protein ParE
MAYALVWSAAALSDLDEIETYINAEKVVERMWEAARKQCDFPYSARMIPEFGTRHGVRRSFTNGG